MSKIFRAKVDVDVPAIWENTAIFFKEALENGSSAKTEINVVLKATDTLWAVIRKLMHLLKANEGILMQVLICCSQVLIVTVDISKMPLWRIHGTSW